MLANPTNWIESTFIYIITRSSYIGMSHMSNIGIYKIVNLKNKKVYVGSSINLKSRKWTHFNSLEKNSHYNPRLQNSYNKYGKNNFKWEVIEHLEKINNVQKLKELVLVREQYWIDKLKAFDDSFGYNICKSALQNSFGIKRSSKFCNEISNRQRGRKTKEETKLKISKSLMGHSVSKETRKKISESNKGRIFSESHSSKLSEALRRRKITEETRKKLSEAGKVKNKDRWRKVENVTTGLIFDNIKMAEDFYNVSRNSIGSVCKGNRKTAGGFIWKYVERGGDCHSSESN